MPALNQIETSPEALEQPDSILWEVPIGLDMEEAEEISFPIHKSQFAELAGLAESLDISVTELLQAITNQFLAMGDRKGGAA